MSLTSLFEQESDALQVQDEQITGIAALARRAKSLEKEIEDSEETLKGLKDKYRKITEEAIPEALAELGMSSFRMEDGSSIDVKPFYSASITEARRAEAFQWLRDHGFDDIIKNTVSVRFGRGEDELCNRLLSTLGQQGFPAEQAEKVEASTLKAWVKERVVRGEEFPMELFGAYIGKKAVIKSV
jgi:predicted O-methyltransferase YrrM